MANPNLPSTIPSTLAPVVQSYTPSVQSPAFSSIVNEVYAPVTYTTAGNITLLPSDVLGGFITHTAAGAENDVLPAASLLIPAIQGARSGLAFASSSRLAARAPLPRWLAQAERLSEQRQWQRSTSVNFSCRLPHLEM